MTAPSDLSPALRLIEAVVDPGSLRSWDEPVEIAYEDGRYREDLARARERTGLDESVITGEGRVRGRRVAVVACEFRFLAGSIGVAAGERLVRAVERATAERLPLLAAPASGGTRMQEGTVAFVQMVKVTAAIADHKAAGLPYLVYLRHPTTGGVLASWGSLGHLTAAEPGALIGFLGPRVHRALYGEEFPAGVQTAENLLTNGLVDAVLPAGELPGVVARALDVLSDGGARVAPPGRAVTGSGDPAGASVTTDGGTDGGGNGGTDGGGAGGTDGGRAGGTGRGSGAGVRADAVVPAADGAGADAGTDISADLGPDDGAGAGTHAGTGTGPAGGERAPGPGAGPAKAPEAPASPSEAPASPSGTPARQSETPAPPPGT
ncbi:carboxyl transferase domain-containing protein, partial [Streptomyces lycii]|uniref:carboxyl transferase domain-containing protein n=1 Tax=Streptomyces lycii TaxID=2654337 RepID=UPI002E261B41